MIISNVKLNKSSIVIIPLLFLFFRGFKYLLSRGVFRVIAAVSIAFINNISIYTAECTGRSVASNIF